MEQLLVAKSDSAPVSQTRCRKFKVQKYYGFAFFIILELFFFPVTEVRKTYICHKNNPKSVMRLIKYRLCGAFMLVYVIQIRMQISNIPYDIQLIYANCYRKIGIF